MSVDDINKGVAGFIKQEGALGKLRGTNQAELNAGTKAYLREMEILTRLTGQSREEMETQREQALSIDAFYATLKELSPDASKEALNTFNQLSAISTKAAAEFASNISGVITGTTDLLTSTGGASMQYTKEYFEKGGKAADAMQGMADAAQQFVGATDQVAKIGGQLGLTSREITMLTNKGIDPFAEAFKKTAEQVDAARAGADRTTDSQAKLRDSQIKGAQNMADFVNLGVKPATIAMQGLTYAVEYLTSFLPGTKKGKEAMARAEIAGNKMRGSSTQGSMNRSGGSGGAEDGNEEFDGSPSGGRPGTSTKGAEGLTLKPGAEKGGTSTETLYNMAQQVHKMLGGNYKYFSGLKDRGIDEGGAHPQGRAFDLVLNDPSQYAGVVAQMRALGGFSQVLDESQGPANPAQRDKWAPHIHAEVSAANGAILSGPRSGYQPNLTMHGTEAVVPLPDGRSIPVAGGADSSGMMSAQLDKLDELISVMKSQLSVSNKLLSYSS
jgi:hypothetical protein